MRLFPNSYWSSKGTLAHLLETTSNQKSFGKADDMQDNWAKNRICLPDHLLQSYLGFLKYPCSSRFFFRDLHPSPHAVGFNFDSSANLLDILKDWDDRDTHKTMCHFTSIIHVFHPSIWLHNHNSSRILGFQDKKIKMLLLSVWHEITHTYLQRATTGLTLLQCLTSERAFRSGSKRRKTLVPKVLFCDFSEECWVKALKVLCAAKKCSVLISRDISYLANTEHSDQFSITS